MIPQGRSRFLIGSLRNITGPIDRQIIELHWRDFAVFVSLSSRTNTRFGFHAFGAALAAIVLAGLAAPRRWGL
jgi:hypothetical protein